MQLDKHSTLLTKYALMGVFLYGVVVNTLHAQEQENSPDIFANSAYVPSGYTSSCMVGDEEMAKYLRDKYEQMKETQLDRNTGQEGSLVYADFNVDTETISPVGTDSCRGALGYSYTTATVYAGGTGSAKKKYGSFSEYGVLQTVPTCPPNPSGSDDPLNNQDVSDHIIMRDDPDNPGAETVVCYSQSSVVENDTCEAMDGFNENHFSSTEGLTCVARDDGSQCPVRRYSAIESASGTTHFYKFDDSVSPSSCYAAEPVDDATGGQSQTDDNGCIASFCPAPREQYTDENGNIPLGCGEINGNLYCTPEKIQEVENRDPTQDPHTPEEPGTEEPGTEEPGTEEPGTGEPGTGEGTVNLSTIESFLAEITGTTAGTRDKVSELQQTVEDTFTVNQSAKGKLPTDEESLNEIAQAEQKLQEKIQEVKTYFTTLFSVQSGAGQFSGCYDILSMKGQTHSACVDEYSDSMNLVSLALLFIFGLISVVILLR